MLFKSTSECLTEIVGRECSHKELVYDWYSLGVYKPQDFGGFLEGFLNIQPLGELDEENSRNFIHLFYLKTHDLFISYHYFFEIESPSFVTVSLHGDDKGIIDNVKELILNEAKKREDEFEKERNSTAYATF